MNQKNVSVINIQSNYSQNNCKQKPAECSDQNEVSKKKKEKGKLQITNETIHVFYLTMIDIL